MAKKEKRMINASDVYNITSIESPQWHPLEDEVIYVQLKPGTTMPPLSEGLPEAEREALAQQLHDYLKALPVQP